MSFTLTELIGQIERGGSDELRSSPLNDLLCQKHFPMGDNKTFSSSPLLYYYLRQGLECGIITGDRLLSRAIVNANKLMDCATVAMAIKYMETPDIYVGISSGEPESVHVLAAIYMKMLGNSSTGLVIIEPNLANILVVLLAYKNANINSVAIPDTTENIHDWLFKTWRINSILPSLNNLDNNLNSKLLGKSATCLLETLLDRPNLLLEHNDQIDQIIELAFATDSKDTIRKLLPDCDPTTLFLLSVLYISATPAIILIHQGYRPNYMEITQLICYIEFCSSFGAIRAVNQLMLILQCILYKGIRLDTHQFNILTSTQQTVLTYCRKFWSVVPVHPLVELTEILGFYYDINPIYLLGSSQPTETGRTGTENTDLAMVSTCFNQEQILNKIREISKSDPNRFKRAILIRRFISLNSLNIIPDSKPGQGLFIQNMLQQSPYCLFDADMINYVDGNGIQWSFISEEFEGILSTKTNPYTGETILPNVLTQMEQQRATLKRLGLGIDSPILNDTKMLPTDDTVLDNSISDMITKYVTDLLFLSGIEINEIPQVPPEKCHQFFQSLNNKFLQPVIWTHLGIKNTMICFMIWYAIKIAKIPLNQSLKLFETT